MRQSSATALLAALLAAACATPLASDQRAMYGGENRAADPALRAADEKDVADAIKAFGDRRAASAALVRDGDAAYRSYDPGNAMRLYNKAWLVDPDNPDVYWGFAAVLYQRDEFCEATRMLDAGQARGPMPGRVKPVAALVYAGCGITLSKFGDTDPGPSFARAEALLAEAEADPSVPRAAVLDAWARYYYGRGDYPAAWAKVAEYRRTVGSEIDPAFLASLRKREPEPGVTAPAPQ